MYHTMLQDTPDQLVFGHELILDTPLIYDLQSIRRLRHDIIDKNKQNINKNCKLHSYRVIEKVLVHVKKENKHKDP